MILTIPDDGGIGYCPIFETEAEARSFAAPMNCRVEKMTVSSDCEKVAS